MPEFKPFRLSEAVGNAQNMAMNTLRIGEAGRQIQARDSLTSALQEGTPEAMSSYRQQFPLESQQYDANQARTNIQKLQTVSLRAEVLGRLAHGVVDENTYQRALQQAKEAGIDITGAPPNYDPNFINQFKEQALSTKQRVDAAIKGAEFEMKRREQRERERHNRAMEGISARKADKENKGGDRSSPSHMNAVTRAAANKLGLQADTTGRLMADVSPDNLLKHNSLAAAGQRIYIDTPGISPAEAIERAYKESTGSTPDKTPGVKLPAGVPAPDKRPVGFKSPDGKYVWSGTGWKPAN